MEARGPLHSQTGNRKGVASTRFSDCPPEFPVCAKWMEKKGALAARARCNGSCGWHVSSPMGALKHLARRRS